MVTVASRPVADKASFHDVAAPFLDQDGLPFADMGCQEQWPESTTLERQAGRNTLAEPRIQETM
jgi:hypothetical protein